MASVILYRGTSKEDCERLINREISDRITWWSTNSAIIDHYYDGAGIKVVMTLNDDVKQDYIADLDSLHGYTYGRMCPKYPKNSIWYSVSDEYLMNNLVSIEEIYEWDAEEDD